MNVTFAGIFALCLSFCLSACGICHAAPADHPSRSSEDFVRVSILSRHIKQVKEKSLREISISFPERTRIFNHINGVVLNVNTMNISSRADKFHLSVNDHDYANPHQFIIKSAIPGAVFEIRSGDERKVYRLPLEVTGQNGNLTFIISEEKVQYALDSASAELGPVNPNQTEALAALSLLILSRIEMIKRFPSHQEFDFCDLTHCQTYSGRKITSGAYNLVFPWRIDTKNTSEMLYFHARCGGQTLGNKVFGKAPSRKTGVKDLLSRQGLYLCGRNEHEWETSITARDLAAIIFPDDQKTGIDRMSLNYDTGNMLINIRRSRTSLSLAPEDFRLRLNRVRGWNFLPGNFYDVSQQHSADSTTFIFRGKGLGHGAGLCQTGALKLASLGYSRHDILDHYFPDIHFAANPHDALSVSPEVSYAVFSLKTGKVEKASHSSFVLRKIPTGSIFKLIVSLYLAAERPSLLNEHHFLCTQDADSNMPANCWLPKGHGRIGFTEALSQSCNLYFGSLYRHISRDRFFVFFNNLRLSSGISSNLPEIKTSREFSRLLTGLDHRVLFSMQDFIKLSQIISLAESDSPGIESVKQTMTLKDRTVVYQALLKTMTDGTGSQQAPPQTPACPDPWGKTATVADGTNRLTHYGIFIGGCRENGVIVVQKNAIGRTAAKSAMEILNDWSKK